jgi:DNA invertase Pin-like site-specific DNA recombinase
MKNAVMYARYSPGPQQTEQSIEGQRNEIIKYAERNGYNIIHEYIDRSLTGTSDKRPQFQKMLLDSAKQKFDYVIVYSLCRFARVRFDSATYKAKLKKNGVKVISATEPIPTDPVGIIVESMLEGMAEYYSAELSQKVKRGIALRKEQCKHIGGFVPIGYTLTEDKKYAVDPLTAPIVEKAFKYYAAGDTLKKINETLTEEYGKDLFGNAFCSLNRIFDNRNYIGYYTRSDPEVKDGVPRIVSDELFERVQLMRKKNKKTPAQGRAHEEYFLTTKLFCGLCKERIGEDVFMVGVSGTSKTGKAHHYYACKNLWNKKGCKKKNVKKHEIESFIISHARAQLSDENIAYISKVISEVSKRENNTPIIAEIKKKLKENAAATENLLKAIESGEHMDLLSERITQKKQERAELEKTLTREQWEKTEIDENEIEFFLERLKSGDENDPKYKRALIAIFINAVYLYDDRMTIIFNTTDKPITIDYDFILDKMAESGYNEDNKGINESSYMKESSPARSPRRQ